MNGTFEAYQRLPVLKSYKLEYVRFSFHNWQKGKGPSLCGRKSWILPQTTSSVFIAHLFTKASLSRLLSCNVNRTLIIVDCQCFADFHFSFNHVYVFISHKTRFHTKIKKKKTEKSPIWYYDKHHVYNIKPEAKTWNGFTKTVRAVLSLINCFAYGA